MRRKFLILLGLLAFFSCGEKKGPKIDSSNHQIGKVVVIFEDCPLQTITSNFGSHLSHIDNRTITFIDDHGDCVNFDPRLIGRDTLEIPTIWGYAEMRHMYQVIEFDSYLLQEGDTVLVRYDKAGRPVLQSLVFENYSDIYNLPYTMPHAVQKLDYSIETVLTASQFTGAYRYFHDKTGHLQIRGYKYL